MWVAAKHPHSKTGLPCWLCSHPEIADAVHDAAELKHSGESEVTWRAFYQKVVELYEYPRSESSFVHHIRHHGTRWRNQ